MVIEKIEVFQTSDGNRFDTTEEAESHQAQLDFIAEYENSAKSQKVLGIDGRAVDGIDVLDYILKNRGKILKLLN